MITAVGGLFIAFHQTRPAVVDKAAPLPASSTQSQGSAAPGSPPSAAPGNTASPAAMNIALPAISEVKIDDGDTVIRILKIELEPYNAENKSLKFTLRFTNNRKYDSNFWQRSFRLLVEGVPQAPVNSLNEVVSSNSAKIGEVVFEIPMATSQAVFQISGANDKTEIPVALTAAR